MRIPAYVPLLAYVILVVLSGWRFGNELPRCKLNEIILILAAVIAVFGCVPNRGKLVPDVLRVGN